MAKLGGEVAAALVLPVEKMLLWPGIRPLRASRAAVAAPAAGAGLARRAAAA
jgi:hypothetical protein